MTLKPLSCSWEDVYHANLLQAFIAPGMELINHTFELKKAWGDNERCIENPERGFRVKFSDVMADWILDGSVKVSAEMLALNPNAANFETTLDHDTYGLHCTAYGPRIRQQVEYVVAELRRNPESRRACIMMLAASDQFVAEAMAAGDTKCEYLCTYAFNFRMRENKLDLIVSMRSNNYVTTVCQDVYVFHRLQKFIADCLNVQTGRYYHSTVSGHVLPGDVSKAAKILARYADAHDEDAGTWNPEWLDAWARFDGVCANPELGLGA